MFEYYHDRVSDNEFFSSPEPSDKDLVFMAQSIGIQLKIGSPILRVLKVTNVISPNKKIRKILEDTIRDMESGENISISLIDNLQELDKQIIAGIGPKHDRLENLPELGNIFQDYAKMKIKNPNYISSEIIGRSIELLSFTNQMSNSLSNGKSVLESLRDSIVTTNEEFKNITETLQELYLRKGNLTNLIYPKFEKHFDWLYVNIIDCGENRENSYKGLTEAFNLLAMP